MISLYPGHTDNIVAMGGAGMLVGVSENDDPDLLPHLPRFSQKAGPESLLAARPDLVLTRGLAERVNPALSGVLAQAGVVVVSIEPPGWDDFHDYLRGLAEALGLDPETGVNRSLALRKDISEAAMNAQAAGRRAPRVLIEATAKELHTCSPDSWAARLVELAGGINAAQDAHPAREGSAIAPWGLERVLKSLSEGLDVYLIQRGAMNASTLESVRARPWAKALEGVRLEVIPEGELSRPSLLGLERGGSRLLEIFYGEENKR